jgi:hypothetical protein
MTSNSLGLELENLKISEESKSKEDAQSEAGKPRSPAESGDAAAPENPSASQSEAKETASRKKTPYVNHERFKTGASERVRSFCIYSFKYTYHCEG